MKYLPAIAVVVSGLCLGLFGGEVLQKMGHGSIMLSMTTAIVGVVVLCAIWMLYCRYISHIYGLNVKVVSQVDSWSYMPLILTVLMLVRAHWPVPRIGTLLLISAVLGVVWIKAGQWWGYRKRIVGFSAWMYAIPLGFSVALVWQMRWPSLNLPRYMVMGQMIGVAIWAGHSLVGKLRPLK